MGVLVSFYLSLAVDSILWMALLLAPTVSSLLVNEIYVCTFLSVLSSISILCYIKKTQLVKVLGYFQMIILSLTISLQNLSSMVWLF